MGLDNNSKKILNLFDTGNGMDYLKVIYNLNDEQIKNLEDVLFVYNPPLLSDEEIENCISSCGQFPGETEEDIEMLRQYMKDRSRRERHPIENCVEVFLRNTGIHPDIYDLSDVKITLRHITAVIDHGNSIREKGLLRLDELLENISPLSEFLKKNGIVIRPKDHKIIVGQKSFELDGKGQFGILASKLYHDLGEIEAFVSGTEDKMIGYSCIMNCPEILYTIDQVYETLNLEEKWNNNKTDLLMIEFDVSFDECFIWDIKEGGFELEDFFSKEYYYDNVPNNVGRNEWIIRNCLMNSCKNLPLSDSYAAIKPDAKIDAGRLRIFELWKQ